MRPIRLLAAVALVLALLAAATANASFKHTVTIKGSLGLYKFVPHKLTIKKGQTVHWTWNSDAPHNVTFGKKLHHRHSTTAQTMSDFKIKFKKAGTYKYTCTVHGFTGKIVVTNG